MLTLLIPAVLAPLIGALAGLAAARWWLTHHTAAAVAPVDPADPFVSAEIDRAASQWATAKGRPEAAGVMADKLHLLYALGRRRRQP
jgi:hypothetical protein